MGARPALPSAWTDAERRVVARNLDAHRALRRELQALHELLRELRGDDSVDESELRHAPRLVRVKPGRG